MEVRVRKEMTGIATTDFIVKGIIQSVEIERGGLRVLVGLYEMRD